LSYLTGPCILASTVESFISRARKYIRIDFSVLELTGKPSSISFLYQSFRINDVPESSFSAVYSSAMKKVIFNIILDSDYNFAVRGRIVKGFNLQINLISPSKTSYLFLITSSYDDSNYPLLLEIFGKPETQVVVDFVSIQLPVVIRGPTQIQGGANYNLHLVNSGSQCNNENYQGAKHLCFDSSYLNLKRFSSL
jgi:hypothetical protein